VVTSATVALASVDDVASLVVVGVPLVLVSLLPTATDGPHATQHPITPTHANARTTVRA
jgi:hypothetical protein